MIKTALFFAVLLSVHGILAQPTKISKEQIAAAERLIDLDFTDAERDSLIGEAQNYLVSYRAIHGQKLDNSLAPALVFDPIPSDFKPPVARFKNRLADRLALPKGVKLPANRAELAFYSLPQLASLLKNKQITSVELTKFYLDRLKKYGDTLHCVINLTEDIALREAAKADAEIQKGKWRGLLHGIPYAAKDLFSVKNTRTTWGAKPFEQQTIDADAAVIQNLRAAGAVLIAKLSMGSLAMGDIWFGGRTRSPWDLTRGSSGSSAGSAAATAAGLVPFALGTETLGSIVSPSTACGTTGLRPTFGRVNRSGAMALSWSMDKIGPITRSAEDAAIVFDAIHGTLGGDKSVRARLPFDYDGKVDWSKLKIGYAKNIFDTLSKTRNEWRTLETLEKLGAKLTPFTWKVTVPMRITTVILESEAAAAFDEMTRTNLDDELTDQSKRAWPNAFRAARFIPAVEYINANRLRTRLIEETAAILRGFDCVIFPNFEGDVLQITNLTGNPTVVVPNGFRDGRPTTVSFIGNLFDEATILAVAKAFQDATDFDEQHPVFFKK